MARKYEFTGETKAFDGRTLRRIRRISDGEVGGWIESEKNLSNSGGAWVYGSALVYGDAQVYGNAEVSGNALVAGNARVYGSALVYGDAQVYGNARVYGSALVYGDAQVYGNARVAGDAQVYGSPRVSGSAWVYGDAQVYGNARVYGSALVYGDAEVSGNALVAGTLKTCVRSDRYTFSVFPCADGVWRLTAGCRFFTMDEAWKHWTATRDGTELGEETFDILVMFEHHIERQEKKGAK